MTKEEFKPPKDPAWHALWIIRNWTQLPKGQLVTYEEIVHKVNNLARAMFDELYQPEETTK